MLAIVNAATPRTYLPPGTCDAAADRLPVPWDAELGYCFWDTKSPDYRRVINSPAYMAFLLSSGLRSVTSLTIQVLFTLTLVAPIVTKPTPYFPCHSRNFSGLGLWQLGHAFL